MDYLLNRMNEFYPYAKVTDELLHNWVEGAKPLAQHLLPETSPYKNQDLSVEPLLIPCEEGLYGRFMGGWPENSDKGVKLFVTDDWSFYLMLLRTALDPIIDEQIESVFYDGSRVKVGVINDVLHPFVSLPDSFSMVRNHSLMLLIGTLWLDSPSKDKWIELYRRSGEMFKNRFSHVNDINKFLKEVEAEGLRIFKQHSPQTLSEQGIWELLSDKTLFGSLLDYILATCFGIAVLMEQYLLAPDREQWLRTQLTSRVTQDNYLYDEINAYCNA